MLAGELAQADLTQDLLGVPAPPLAPDSLEHQPEGDVTESRQPRIKRRLLKNQRPISPWAGDGRADEMAARRLGTDLRPLELRLVADFGHKQAGWRRITVLTSCNATVSSQIATSMPLDSSHHTALAANFRRRGATVLLFD
jgi:hypothetical protein